MTNEAWQSYCNSVSNLMGAYVSKFVTPLSMSPEVGMGKAWATGNYLYANKRNYLLTNKHVFSDCPSGAKLAHLPFNVNEEEDYYPIEGTPTLIKWPVDAGLIELTYPEISTTRLIKASLIDTVFNPVQDELLFWAGHPGYKAQRNEPLSEGKQRMTRFLPKLDTKLKPFLSQLIKSDLEVIKDFDINKHIAIHYPAMAHKDASADLVHCANPKGMSGSLLWDTKFLSHLKQGKEWSPECARVCGLIWGAHEHPYEIVVATKIEYVLDALPILKS